MRVMTMSNRCETEVFSGSCRGCGGTDLYQVVNLNEENGGIQVAVCCRECGWRVSLPHLDNLQKRTNSPLRNWSVQVRKRDGMRCVVCGSIENLQAHHIIRASVNRGLALSIGNGVTLCARCHLMAHANPQPAEALQEESRWADGREENVTSGSGLTLRELTEKIVPGFAELADAFAPEKPEALLPKFGDHRVRHEDGKWIVRLDSGRWEFPDDRHGEGYWVPDPAHGPLELTEEEDPG